MNLTSTSTGKIHSSHKYIGSSNLSIFFTIEFFIERKLFSASHYGILLSQVMRSNISASSTNRAARAKG